MEIKRSLSAYAELMRLDKPIGILLLLWPTAWALWFSGHPTPEIVIIFTLGVIIMRSAGCVINDYADRDFDGEVARTKNRPLPTGRATLCGAKWLFAVLIFGAFLLLCQLNILSWGVALIAVFFVIIYPFMKRYTYFPQIILAIAYSLCIPMVYAATQEMLPLSCWILFVANACWNMAYDTQYAMVDREDDIRIGIKSVAVWVGRYDIVLVGMLQTIMVACLFLVGRLEGVSWGYYLSLLLISIIFIWQCLKIWHRLPTDCFRAFLSNSYVGFIVWLGVLSGLYL